MNNAIGAVIFSAFMAVNLAHGAPFRFEKLSDHFYTLQIPEQDIVSAIVTDEGILIVNPPEESGLQDALDALKRLSLKPVRWVAFTDPRYARNAGAKYFADHGALLLASNQFRALSKKAFASSEANASASWIYFSRQMHLFPAGLEIRIIAVPNKARTGGDVVVFAPAEKVLITGALYQLSYYPDIDMELEGDALGWIDGMKQVVASVPLLKLVAPAKTTAAETKPQSKPAPKSEPEKTLEESILVVSAHGISNLQGMKEVLEYSQKLRDDLSRRVKSGSSCDSFLVSIGADLYRKFGNLDGYLPQLCAAIEKRTE
jgi:hypothetical protein